MGELYFVRHGQASYGSADYDRLSALGEQQSTWLGQHLRQIAAEFDQVVVGGMRRHEQTLSAMFARQVPELTIRDARLNEMAYFELEKAFLNLHGCAAPKNTEALAALFIKVMAAWERGEIPGNHESFAAFKTRILTALRAHAVVGKKTLIVSSGGPLGVLMRDILGFDNAALTQVILSTHNASYSRFHVREEGLRLHQFNAISHLEHPDRSHARTFI